MTTAQPPLGSRTKKIIEVDGLKFRDLDGDGELTPYEDWRLTPRQRAEDLTSRLRLEHKAGLMIIGSHYMAGSHWVGEDGGMPDQASLMANMFAPPRDVPGGSQLRTKDSYAQTNPITGARLPAPKLHASSADGAINARHQRRMILRDNPTARGLADWTNELQAMAEDTEFGIPIVLASNPRNHVSPGATMGVSEGGGIFSEWPGELGLAASMDPSAIRQFAEIARREWRSVGLHKIYGYMADLPTEARWARFNGTFGENPDDVSAFIREMVLGFQGDELGPESIAITVKHFPGGGVRTDGHDPHFPWGQTNDYPVEGSLAKYHLPPFEAAIAAGVSSVMPYYSRPVNTSTPQLPADLWQSAGEQFEEVAFAYNAAFLRGLLRDKLGFTGYINTDSGVLDTMAYGVEDLSKPERWAKIVHAGTNVVSDESDPADLITAVEQGLLAESELDESVTLLLAEMFALGLFENPYVDADVAEAIAADAEARRVGLRAQHRSVTLLRNTDNALPVTAGKIYAQVFSERGADALTSQLRAALQTRFGNDAVADDLAEADQAIVWVQPAISLFGGDRPDTPLSIDPRDLGIDVDEIRRIQQRTSTVTVMNFTNPWLIGEIEPGAAALVGTYDVSAAALVDVLTGTAEPSGRLPLTIPASAQVMAASPRDVPGFECGPDYAYVDSAGSQYQYGFGLDIAGGTLS